MVSAIENAIFPLFLLIALCAIAYLVYERDRKTKAAYAAMPREQRADIENTQVHGSINPIMVCPHCQTRGQIRTKLIIMKKGVSGGKAAAAVMTAGISTLAVGLSRKENLTQAWCGACKNSWVF